MQRRRPLQDRGDGDVRRRIAVEAARLIAEGGLRDFHDAKLKAAARVGAFDEACLPRNIEIEEALREHQRLFQGDSQPRQLLRLHQAAIEAMRFLACFEPRLVGAVLDGSADAHSAVRLHLFSDDPREILVFLDDHRIPYEEQTRTPHAAHAPGESWPALRVSADDVAIEITVFPLDGLRQAPPDRVTGKPMQRATLAAVEALVAGRPGARG